MHSQGLTLAYLAASAVAAVAAGMTWRRRDASGAVPLALMIVAAALWALLDALELQAVTVSGKRLVSQLQYVAVVATAPLFLHAAVALARRETLLRGTLTRWAVWAIPGVTLVVAATSAWHPLLWRSISIPDPGTNLGIYRYGPWFWVFTAHAYVLLAVGTTVLLAAAGRVTRPYRASMVVVVAAVLLPWAGNVAYLLKLGPWPGLNWLSLSLVASGSLLAWGARGGGLFDLLPRAREALLAGLADGVVILDLEGRIMFRNPAAQDLLGLGTGEARLPGSLRFLPPPPGSAGDGWQMEVATEEGSGGEGRWLDVRATALLDRWRDVAGQLLVVRDVTRRHALEEAREKLIDQLRAALDEVQALRGMLPICASCRKVRSDAGYWQRIDEYLSEKTPVVFSHGLCPDCAEELYPEVARDIPREE